MTERPEGRDRRLSARRWRRPGTLFSALMLSSISVFPAFLIGAVSVQLRADLGLDRAELGTAVSAFFISSAVTVATIGKVVDRIGERRSHLLGSGLALVSLLAVATVARSWLTLALTLSVGGIGNAVVGPASSRILAHAVDPMRRGWAFGVKQAAIMGATLLALNLVGDGLRDALDPKLRARLEDYYREDAAALREFTGLPLTEWSICLRWRVDHETGRCRTCSSSGPASVGPRAFTPTWTCTPRSRCRT